MSALASTSRVQMRYIAESTFGVTPGAGNANNLRMTGESLNYDLSKEQSKEIRSDRQIGGAVTVDADASGDINFHFQYNEYDGILAGLMMSAYSVYGTAGVGTSFSAAYTATTITASVAPTGSSDFTTLQKGQWFKVVHAGNANDGKWFRVSTSVAPTTTVITLDAGTPASVVGSTAGCTIATSRLTNGTTETSFSIEKNLTDITQFICYRGMYASKMGLKLASGALIDGSFSFMGKDPVRAAVTALPGTPVASRTFDVQNAVRGVGQLWEGTAPLTGTYLKSVDINVDNNLRAQKAVANMGAVGIGVGDFVPSGSFSAYFANGTLYDKFLADTYTALTVGMQDTAGNGYVITLPRIQLMSAKVTAGAKNQDIMADFTWTAFADLTNATAALQKTMFIDRLGVAAT